MRFVRPFLFLLALGVAGSWWAASEWGHPPMLLGNDTHCRADGEARDSTACPPALWRDAKCVRCSDDPLLACFDGCLCPIGPCYAPLPPPPPSFSRKSSNAGDDNGTKYSGCLASPWHMPPRPTPPFSRRHFLECKGATADPLPPRPPATATDHEARLARFQRQSAHPYPNWRRWGGQCRSPSAGGTARGYHNTTDGFYRLQNVCISPRGGLSFFTKQAHPSAAFGAFFGTHEMAYKNVAKYPPHSSGLTTLLGGARVLSKPPDCVMDTETALFLPTYTNVGHVVSHVLTWLAARQHVFRDPQSALTLIAEGEFWKPKDPSMASAMAHFAPLVAEQFGTVFTRPPNAEHAQRVGPAPPGVWTDEERDLFLRGLPDPAGPDASSVCFDSVVIPHVCRASWGVPHPCMGDVPLEKLPKGNEHTHRLVGLRRPSDRVAADLFRSAVGQCLGLDMNRPVRRDRPRLLYALRSSNRVNARGFAMGRVATLAEAAGFEGPKVVELRGQHPADLFRLYADADAVIGPLGTGFTWAVLLLPLGGAVGIDSFFENIYWGSYQWASGYTLRFDFPGTAAVRGLSTLLGGGTNNKILRQGSAYAPTWHNTNASLVALRCAVAVGAEGGNTSDVIQRCVPQFDNVPLRPVRITPLPSSP